MTALNFPDSPSNGDTYQGYTYNSTKGTWAKPAEQDARTAVYANIAALPTSGTAGDMAYVTATNRLYIWTGTGWYNIALINNNPTISGVNATYNLAIDGTATVITITATDPEGLPITYSIASDTSGNTATVTQGTGASTNVFTITPSTNDAHAGTFSLTFRASDGVNIASAAASFTLEFKVTNSRYTTALITSVGANNATNASFDDKSTNDHTITVNGDSHQTTFSPYRPGGYAEHFTNDRISYANHSSLQIGTQDFCMEAWIKLRTQGANYERYVTHQASWAQAGVKGVEFAAEQTGTLQLNVMIDGSSSTDFGYVHNIEKERWYHTVITRESGHARIFIDGVLENNAANTTNINGSGGTHFGTNTAGTDQMDDFLIRDFRLCIGGVPTDYSTTSTTNDATIFTPPQAHITKTSQGATASEVKALLFNTPYVQDNSDNTNASLTYHSKGVTTPDGPYDTLQYSAATDLASVHFDGTGDYLAADSKNIGNFGTDDFSVEGWFYLSAASTNYVTVVETRTSGATNTGWVMAISASDFYIYSYGHIVRKNSAILSNQWNHWAYTRESGTHRLFLNGKTIATNTGDARTYSDNNFKIGNAGHTSEYFTGNQADIRVVKGTAVYTSDFTPPTSPVSAVTNTSFLLQNTDAGIIDKSQRVKTVSLLNGVKSSTSYTKYLTSSIDFTGSLAYIQPGGLIDTFAGDYTVEAWIWSADIDNGGTNNMALIDFRPSGGNGQHFALWAKADNKLGLYINSSYRIQSNTLLTDSTWHHIAISRQSGTTRMFIDGTLQTQTWSDTNNYTTPAGRPFIGNSSNHITNANHDWNGYMSDIRFTAGLARYTANFTPPTAELKG